MNIIVLFFWHTTCYHSFNHSSNQEALGNTQQTVSQANGYFLTIQRCKKLHDKIYPIGVADCCYRQCQVLFFRSGVDCNKQKMHTDCYLEGLSTRSIAIFVAGVRLTARAKRKVTNQQIAGELVTIRERLGLKSTLVISGKLVSYWGSEKKLVTNRIDTETLAAILAYCFQNQLCPENTESITCLLKVHQAIGGNSALPDYIKKRLTGVGVQNGQ